MRLVWVISSKTYDDYEADSLWTGSREEVAAVLARKAAGTTPDNVSATAPSLGWAGDILYGACVGTGLPGWKAEAFPVRSLPRIRAAASRAVPSFPSWTHADAPEPRDATAASPGNGYSPAPPS